MESEHRELGLGDPTLGKTVRKLVGSLAAPRRAVARCDRRSTGWDEATRDSLYKDRDLGASALEHIGDALRDALGSGSRRPSSTRSAEGGSHDRPLRASACGSTRSATATGSTWSPTRRSARAIAERLGLPGIDRLEAHATLARDGELVRAAGRLVASLEQSCVVTGEPVPAHVDEPFELDLHAGAARPAGRTRRSSWREAIATSSFTTARRSTSARRSPIRWRSASTPIRAARAPKPRSRKRAS